MDFLNVILDYFVAKHCFKYETYYKLSDAADLRRNLGALSQAETTKG